MHDTTSVGVWQYMHESPQPLIGALIIKTKHKLSTVIKIYVDESGPANAYQMSNGPCLL